MMLCRLAGVMLGVEAMAMRDMSVVPGEMMLAILVVPGGFPVMLGRILVMLSSGVMMIGF